MEPLIRMTGITRYFGQRCAVQDLSLELLPGEIVGLLGANGAGKTTSMRILSGCLGAHQGSVLLDGVDLFKAPLRAKRSIGYLPETPPIYPELTVDEYLTFCARLKAVNNSAIKTAMEQAKAVCGLDKEGSRVIRNLSKGYQQRLGLAQAIIHQPRVIILDEPTSGLDPNQIIEIRNLIRMLGEKQGVILSTHILPEVQAVCDRVLILHHGRLIYSGKIAQLSEAEGSSTVTVGLSRPPEQAAIAMLRGVEDVSALEANRFTLRLTQPAAAESLLQQMVQRDWGPTEFTPGKPDLEQIFYRLTTTTESGV